MNKRNIFRSLLGIAALSLTLVTASVWAQDDQDGKRRGGQRDKAERQGRQMQYGEGRRSGMQRPMLCPDCQEALRDAMKGARNEDGKIDREKMKQVREKWMGEKKGDGKQEGKCAHCGKDMPERPKREIKCPECGASIEVPMTPRFRDRDGDNERPRFRDRDDEGDDDRPRFRERDDKERPRFREDRRPRRGQDDDDDDDDDDHDDDDD